MNLSSIIDRGALYFPEKTALAFGSDRFTYKDLKSATDRVAFYLRERGVRHGDRIAVYMPNRPEWLAAYYGIIRLGAVAVCIGAAYKKKEIEQLLNESATGRIVTCDELAAQVPKHSILPSLKDTIVWENESGLESVFRSRSATTPKAFPPVDCDPDDACVILFTGGTTGAPKGAMLTHRNILANLEQTGVWISDSFKEGSEIVIAPLPMYHIFCLTSTLSFMKWGSLSVLITNPRDLPALVKEMGSWKFTTMTGVNTLFNGLLNTPGFDRLDFSALKVVVGGGAAVLKPVAERWQQVTGHYLTEAYGLTETSPGACATPLGSAWDGTVGLPLPSTELSIRDEEFAELPVWTGAGDIEKHTGEICVRGPQVMKGYWNNPAETANVLHDGWLKTGDVGHLDDRGRVTITDRKKDMILVSGFNVYPNEVEAVVAAHPGVLECAVVAVPDEKSGEAVKVVIVKKDPDLTKAAVIEYCRALLTSYKLPRHVEFRDVLPKTPIGKILRRELRETLKG